MGGADKGLISYQGRSLVSHAIDRLAPQVSHLLISANRNLDAYRGFGHPVISDSLPDYPGPLAGLAAGLAACPTPWIVTCPCDCPALPVDLVARLLAAAEARQVSLAVAVTAEGMQPTFQLCRRENLPQLNAYLAGGGRKVGAWCSTQAAVEVNFPDSSAFFNLNAPADLGT
jgi:molybdenum cofactor guanylyltransferase